MAAHGHHPYSPAELQLPGFVPQRLSQVEVVSLFLGASLLLILAVWLVSGRCGGRLSRADRLAMCWWAFTGLAHILLEGPVLLNRNFFTKENPNFVDELFKEYSKGDSRYIARDTGITALALRRCSHFASGKSYSHVLQFAVSVCHLYGCLFYFTTAYLAGFNLRASPFYFWAYFIVANGPWAVAPALIATRSWKKICAAAFQAEKVKTR